MTPEDEAANLFERAETLRHIRRYDEALPLIMRAATLEPNNAQILAEASIVNICLNDLKQGLNLAEKAAVADPEWVLPHRLRFIVLLHHGKMNDALSAANEAVRLGPNDPDALLCLVDVKLALNAPEDALPIANRMVEVEPDNSRSFLALADVLQKLKRPDQATWAAQKALSLDPESVSARVAVGQRLEGTGATAEALRWYMDAARIDPGDETPRKAVDTITPSFLVIPFLIYFGLLVELWYRYHLGLNMPGSAAYWCALATVVALAAFLQAKAPRVLLHPQPGFRRLPDVTKEVIYSRYRRNWGCWIGINAVIVGIIGFVILYVYTVAASVITDRYHAPFDPPPNSTEWRQLDEQRRRDSANRKADEEKKKKETGVEVEEYGNYKIRRIDPTKDDRK